MFKFLLCFLFLIQLSKQQQETECQCPKGEINVGGCTTANPQKCQACPWDQFWYKPEGSGPPNCYPCSKCRRLDEEKVKECGRISDTECRCKAGFYLRHPADNFCTEQSVCPAGQYVVVQGTHLNDNRCDQCPLGTFTNEANTATHCLPHTDCAALNLTEILPGDANNDAFCGTGPMLPAPGPAGPVGNPATPAMSVPSRQPKSTATTSTSRQSKRTIATTASTPILPLLTTKATVPDIPRWVVWAILAACVLLLLIFFAVGIWYIWKKCEKMKKKSTKPTCNGEPGTRTESPDEEFQLDLVGPGKRHTKKDVVIGVEETEPCLDRHKRNGPKVWSHANGGPGLEPIQIGVMEECSDTGQVFANNMKDNWAFKMQITDIMAQTRSCLASSTNPVQQRHRIAILDSGIQNTHPVFEGFTFTYVNCVDAEQGIAPSRDPHGHGTFVAGVICEMFKDLKHLIEIVIIKVVDKNGMLIYESVKNAYEILLSDAMSDVQLICQPNGFLHRPHPQFGLKEILKRITMNKALICAASNEGSWRPDTIAWPAVDSVAIGSHDKDAGRLSSSPQGQQLHVLAPGDKILSANAMYDHSVPGSPKLRLVSGTSFAAPWTVGLLVHLLVQIPYRCPSLPENRRRELGTTDHVKSLLRNMTNETFTKERGYGHLMPWENAFENNLKFKTLILDTFKMHGINNVFHVP